MPTLYRWTSDSLEEAAKAVGGALGMELTLHDSSFYGGDYFRVKHGEAQVIVLVNYVEDDDERFFPTQPVGAICVEVDGLAGAEEKLAILPGLRRA